MKRHAWLFSLPLIIAACGGGTNDAANKPAADGAAATAASTSSPDWRPSIKTAAVPGDPCAWIPPEEVEAVMGKLAEPPRKADGCRYTLVIPEAVVARRQQAKATQEKLQEKLRKAFGTPEEPLPKDSIFAKQDDPRSYAVSVKVDVDAGVEGEQALSSVARQFGFGENKAGKSNEGAKVTSDWDDVREIPYGFIGRTGHVRVSVQSDAPDMPDDQFPILAARVRDRVPDLPFAVTNPYQVIQLGSIGDPCSLLTRAEVESVLGPLAIEPYRSSSEKPPLAHGKGHACAYFTPGHHVLAISPTWSDGAQSFKLEKGIGGLVGIVAPQEQVVIKGPWDAAHTGMSGALMFLKGDRLLEVHYATSRASRGDAVKLAAIAMKRFAP